MCRRSRDAAVAGAGGAAYKPRSASPGITLMLYAIALLATTDGKLRAIAPDLTHCDLTGSTEQELLPKLRLTIEGELTRLLLAGEPLPDSRNGEPAPGFSPSGTFRGPVRWLHVHINVGHLEALARHQAGR